VCSRLYLARMNDLHMGRTYKVRLIRRQDMSHAVDLPQSRQASFMHLYPALCLAVPSGERFEFRSRMGRANA
jgi:hypothetical protein